MQSLTKTRRAGSVLGSLGREVTIIYDVDTMRAYEGEVSVRRRRICLARWELPDVAKRRAVRARRADLVGEGVPECFRQ